MASKIPLILVSCIGIVVVGFLLLFVAFMVFSRAEVPVYTHAPTADLFQTGDLDAPKLAAVTADGVTVHARMVQGHSEVRATFACKVGGTLTFDRVEVSGRGAKASARHAIEVGQTLTLAPNKKGTFQYANKTVALGLGSADYDALGAEGYRVAVTFHVGERPPQTVEVLMDRTVKTVTVWPT